MDRLLQKRESNILKTKLQSIKNIKVPANAAELYTILGMVHYLNKFSVKLAEYTIPLR